MARISMIACISKDRGLGQGGDLLWQIPTDMQFFRQTTIGHPVVMGGKTFRSIGRPLPKRQNIVLSHTKPDAQNVIWFDNLKELQDYLDNLDEEVFIIGGASLYQTFLPQTDTLYLTEVSGTRPADTFFPEFQAQNWRGEVLMTGNHEDVTYQIKQYTRQPEPGV